MNLALALAPLAVAFALAIYSRWPARRFFIAFILGLLAMRVFVFAAPDDWRYLASCAVWVAVGSDAIRRGLIAPGALLIASGLCYGGQEIMRLAPVFGNPFLVAADVFGWLFLLGAWRDRDIARIGEVGPLGSYSGRRSILALGRGYILAKEAGR